MGGRGWLGRRRPAPGRQVSGTPGGAVGGVVGGAVGGAVGGPAGGAVGGPVSGRAGGGAVGGAVDGAMGGGAGSPVSGPVGGPVGGAVSGRASGGAVGGADDPADGAVSGSVGGVVSGPVRGPVRASVPAVVLVCALVAADGSGVPTAAPAGSPPVLRVFGEASPAPPPAPPAPPPGAGVPAPGARYAWPLLPAPAVLDPFRAPAHAYGPGHRGADLAGTVGQPVLAARDGRVVFAGPVAGRGVVSVHHDDGLRTTYEPVRPVAAPGAAVRAGDVIALLEPGHPACAPQTCLHWGVRRDRTEYLDPLVLLQPTRVRLLPVPDPWPVRGRRDRP